MLMKIIPAIQEPFAVLSSFLLYKMCVIEIRSLPTEGFSKSRRSSRKPTGLAAIAWAIGIGRFTSKFVDTYYRLAIRSA